MNDQLNHPQKEAVDTLEGPVLVLAGAGAGKTKVVTTRIINLIENGAHPSQILGLTFTNKAAREMKERVERLTNHEVLITTFHSLGARILRESIHHLGYQSGFTIYDEEDSEKVLKECFAEVVGSEAKQEIRSLKSLVSSAKNCLNKEDLKVGSQWSGSFLQIFNLYQSKLFSYNAVDYDDLLALPVRLFREHPSILAEYQNRWRYLLIDEYQDTNALQYALVNDLVAEHGNLCVVGDPDQSIYSWRGANINNIMNFERDYPSAKIVRLEQNYRSHSNILNGANALITHNQNRYEKKLWSALGPGEKIKIYRADNDKAEAAYIVERVRLHHIQGIPYNNMVIFYRTNAQSRVFEDLFLSRKVPYLIVGGVSFYQRREIKDILAWLRMIYSGCDFISFARTINLPKRGIGDTTLDRLRLGAAQEKLPILDYCLQLLDNSNQILNVKLSAKQKEGLQDYLKTIKQLQDLSQTASLSRLVTATIENTYYWTYLEEDPETMADRKENLNALVSKAAEWEQATPNPSLIGFLEELSLKSTLDEDTQDKDKVRLMTVHNGKGLEFRVTFLAGLEEDLFPHINSRDNEAALEEERRLCYVGMTRAKEYLYLTHATSRAMWGVLRTQRASRFLSEVPLEYVEKVNMTSARNPVVHRPVFSSQNTTKKEFSNGDLIYHQEFGIGKIQDIYEGSAGLTYRIFFTKENRERNLVARYASLTHL